MWYFSMILHLVVCSDSFPQFGHFGFAENLDTKVYWLQAWQMFILGVPCDIVFLLS
jgi:hypothetical protein